MVYSDAARQSLTEAFEGDVLTAYPDPGTGAEPFTIGYGHTGPDVTPGLIITQAQADALLEQDVQSAVNAVNIAVTATLTQHQADALIDFAFNVGVANFRSSTLLKLVNAGDMADADLEFARWIRAAGKVLPGLVKRRAAEAAWFDLPDNTPEATS